MCDALIAQRQQGSAMWDAAPSLRPHKHPNSKTVHALWLGDGCDGLTAVFAAVNGIRLALAHQHRLTAFEVHQLIGAGLHFFDGRLSPQQSVLSGVRVQHWHALISAMTEVTDQLTGVRIRPERIHVEMKHDRRAVFQALDDSVARLRVPLLLLRGGIYTAVSGTTPASILLFDSRGYSWISKRACGVPGDCVQMRHMIYPSALVALDV